MRAIRNGLHGAGIPVENSKGEWGPGQEEINVQYAEALEMADRHAIIKNGCKEIAYGLGKAVTFMAKWDYGMAGSSCHVHQSLWSADGKSPLFFDKAGEHGMSETMKHYLAGQLEHAGEITYFLAPYINSYKRFMAGTFAPTRAVWSFDNRTAGFGCAAPTPRRSRVECRVGGADLNPLPRLCGAARRRARRHREEDDARARILGATPTIRRSSSARSPRPCARR